MRVDVRVDVRADVRRVGEEGEAHHAGGETAALASPREEAGVAAREVGHQHFAPREEGEGH